MAASGSKVETIAIIGAGEMGTGIGRRLRQKGARVLTEIKGRSAASIARCRCSMVATLVGVPVPEPCMRPHGGVCVAAM